ncbi:hypothetical protein N8I77_005556 [Diaporthe amygdali]|uniref:Alpha/beta hydrolase fold-3 domain-containing protein n=1 Tax=Phomopsis amygdali TaxID=1214568 RepID=A0AAD9W332_PHOAM|nr:hypothetical protein N8I77_005556 [Diaporthe amygdali]
MCDFSVYGTPSPEWLIGASKVPSFTPQCESIIEWRTIFNKQREATTAEEFKSLKPHVQMKDYSVPTSDGSSIEVRSYRPASVDATKSLPVYMHLHGGGFLFGTLATEDAICARIAINAQVVVLSVNFRHTPEYGYPTAWNDTADAFEWLHDHISELGGDAHRVVLGGISSGGQLSAAFVLKKHLGKVSVSRPAIVGQLLLIPCLAIMDCYEPQRKKLKSSSVCSYEQNRLAPLMPLSVCRFFTELLQIESPRVDDIELNPGNASPAQVRGLPPTVFTITGWDPLRDEGLLYAKMLAEAG